MADVPSFDAMVPDAPAQAAPPGSFDALVDDSQAQQQEYGTPDQQLKAGVEGLIRGIAGPLATAIEKNYYRVPERDILGRQEANPVTAGVGEGVGLVGGALTGTGEAAALESVGKLATEAAGLAKPIGYTARVGSSIVKNAAEMAAYQTGDEATKMILNDPSAGAQSAITNIGLSAALGAGAGGLLTGAVSPLWEATVGSKAAEGLKALVSRIGGIEGSEASGKAADLEAKTGIALPDDIKSVINDEPMARENHSVLSQDDSSIAGRNYQKRLAVLDNDMGVKTAEALGKTPEDIVSLPEKNNYESGQKLGETLRNDLEPAVKDIDTRYESTTDKFKQKPTWEVKRTIADDLAQKSISEGWAKSFDDANNKLIQKITEKLPEQNTINDLKLAISNLYRPYDAPDYRAAVEAKKILSKGLETAIAQHMGPEELASYGQLRKDYATMMGHLEDLDTHLHLGKWSGPKTFLDALSEKANQKGETLLANFTGKNNAALLDLLKAHPNTLEAVSNHYKDSLIRSATKTLNPGELIRPGKLLRDIEAMSPQQKALIASPEQHAKIQAINELKESLIDPKHNFSNTARTLRKLASGAVSPLSVIAMFMGHGGAGIMSYLAGLGIKEGVPAMRLAMMKMLGSTKPVDAAGFAAAAKYFNAANKGAKLLSTTIEDVFKPGVRALNVHQIPSPADIAKLDKLVATNDPDHTDKLMAQAENGKVGHYLPEHQTALTASSMQALQYLKTLKPQEETPSPLGVAVKPTPAAKARYDRALMIAQQPAVVLQHVKDGTIQASDVQDLNSMYPALYQQLSQKLSSEMIAAKSNGTPIPYKTRMGISLFLGQAMDVTMQPTSIQAAQGTYMMAQPNQGPQQPMKGRKGKTAIDKAGKQYMTPNQAAESDRGNRD